MSFLRRFFGVQAEKGSDALIEILVRWDPAGATEAERREIGAKLSAFCLKCEEAKKKMRKEEADVTAIRKQAGDKLALAKKWQAEIENPATEAARKATLQQKLPALMQELKELGPRIDQEVKEAELAKKVFETYDKVVVATNQKLQQKAAQSKQLTAELELAKTEQALVNDQVDAARVLNGLQTATDSFTVASNAISKETEKAKAKTAAMLREADLLTANSKEDDFVAAELAAVNGTGETTTSITDQFAALEKKLG